MADPAELIREAVHAWIREDAGTGIQMMMDARRSNALVKRLAALTPQPSAEDAAVLLAFQAAAIDAYTQHDGPSELDAKREQLRAAVLARMAVKVPTGWKLVPVVPTEAMFNAVIDLGGRASFEDEYRAAVAAAPEAPR